MKLIEVLENLSNVFGVAGREKQVKDLMLKFLKPHVDEMREDRLGNIIGVKNGEENSPKIMLAAHMDEIGLMAKRITKEGFIQFTKIGGIDDRILLAQKVLVYTNKGPLHGIIGSKPPHIQKKEERKQVISHDKLFIDIGANNQEEVKKSGVKIGDIIGFDVKFTKVGENRVIGKAFDNRAGCAALIEVMRILTEEKCTVYAVGTVQEEVGLRGAKTASYGLEPDIGLAIDVTVAGDTPGVREVESDIKLSNGPVLTVMDRGLVTHPKVLRLLENSAEKNKIPYQLEAGIAGSTDAARISISREGVPSGVISVPTRYIHSPTSLLDMKDLENSVNLVVSAIKGIDNNF